MLTKSKNNSGLPQGAVTSPALSNLVTAKLDRRLSGYTSRRNIVYTRYADDITFSSNNPNKLSLILYKVFQIIESEGFKINSKKIRLVGPKKRCQITGLVKNASEKVFGIGMYKKRKIRAVMYNMIIKNKISEEYKNMAAIEGWLSYAKSIDEKSYIQMKKYFEKLKLGR